MFLDSSLSSDFKIVIIGSSFLLMHELLVRLVLVRCKEMNGESLKSYIFHPLVLERLAGILLMGIGPLLLLSTDEKWLFWSPTQFEVISIIVLCLFIALIGIRIVSKVRYTKDTMQEIVINRNLKSTLLTSILWICYLAAYECLMRGILLFPIANMTNIAVSILFNVLIYFLLHIKKGWQQSYASIPFGIILCMSAFATQSFWPAYLLHLSLALPISWYIHRKNNDKFFLKLQQL